MLMVNELVNHHTNHFLFNPKLKAFPHGLRKKEITGKDYTPQEIETILNLMNLSIKDKDAVKMICIRESDADGPAIYALDKAFFDKHCITDPFILAQLERVVQSRNISEQKQFNESKKDKTEIQQDLMKQLVQDEYPQYENLLKNDHSAAILYRLIRKSRSTLNKKLTELKTKNLDKETINDSNIEINNKPTKASYSTD